MTRLALVLGGPASLGAYSAGAVTEILGALHRNRGDAGVTVGVVTGASAGGLSAAMAARALVVNPALVPWLEPFWVKGMSADHLLDPGRRDRSGLLDVEPMEQMVDEMVAGPPAADDGPSPALGGPLQLGFSVVDLPGHREGDEGRRHGHDAVFRLAPSHGADNSDWRHVRDAALAAAGYAGAFPLRRLARRAAGSRPGSADLPRWTGDGLGTEHPLSLAGRLAARAPSDGRGGWRFLVVDPRGHGAGAPEGGGRVPTSPAGAAARLLEASLGLGLARDGRESSAGERGRLLGALVDRLPEIHGRLDDAGAVGLGRRVGELAERVAEWEVRRAGGGEGEDPALDHLDRRLEAIAGRADYRDAFGQVESRAGRTRLAKLVYVLEAAAGARGRVPGPVHRVTPAEPLAGDRMACLGGFLDAGWRASDFAAGRRDARRVLEEELASEVAYEPADDGAYESPASAATPLSDAARRRLLSHLEAEADAALRDLRPGGLAGLLYGLVRPGLRRSVARRTLEALERG